MHRYIKILLTCFIGFGLLFLFTLSCKKKNDKLTISGFVSESNTTTPAKDVSVELQAQKVMGGTYSSVYETISTGKTGSDGKFSFAFDNIRVSNYKLIFDKTNYFGFTKEFSGSLVIKGEEYNRTYQIYPAAWLRLHIKNVYPVNGQDYFSYYLTGGTSTGYNCCSDTTSKFWGNVDVIRKCKTYSNQNITINWIYTKNNTPHINTTNVSCAPFDTTSVDLFY